MKVNRLTLKELAARLSESAGADERRRMARQIQHWVEAGLLHPVGGDRHPGRGVPREFGIMAVYDAAILADLAWAAMPVVWMKRATDELRRERTRARR